MIKLHETHDYLKNPTHPITITLIGAGGTGSLMLSRLARIDYALKQSNMPGLQIEVYDFDTVEKNNIGRQLFSFSDLGENKAFTLVGKINRNFLTTHRSKDYAFSCVNELNYSQKAHSNVSNIYITATDNAEFRVEFHEFFNKISTREFGEDNQNAYYWMDFGNSKNTGQCVLASRYIKQNNPDNTNKLPSIVDKFPSIIEMDTEEIQGRGCSYQAKLEEQSLFINDTLSTLGAHLLQELLTKGYTSKAGFFVNLETLKTNPISV